jgi:Glutathione S-transferase, N-terminal domain
VPSTAELLLALAAMLWQTQHMLPRPSDPSPYRLFEVNPQGSVPVLKDIDTGEWFVDSAKFCDYIEDKHPEPPLGKTQDIPDVYALSLPVSAHGLISCIAAAPMNVARSLYSSLVLSFLCNCTDCLCCLQGQLCIPCICQVYQGCL